MRVPRVLLATLLFFNSTQLWAQEHPLVPLWPNGAPGFESRKDQPENVKTRGKAEVSVSGVNNPSLTLYLPAKDKASGAGIVICPGGGHSVLVLATASANRKAAAPASLSYAPL